MWQFFQTILLCGALLWTSTVTAGGTTEPGQQDVAIRQLQSLLAPVASMSGLFTQTLTGSGGELIQQSHGEFSVKRPGKFLWHTAAPFEQVLVSDQQTLWLYDPDLEQVTVRAFDQRLQQTPALLLSGRVEELSHSFIVQVGAGDQQLQQFTLIPKDDEKLFESLSLTFVVDGPQPQLQSMILVDALGQETLFTLTAVKANPALDDALFHFQVPEGTDVLIDE